MPAELHREVVHAGLVARVGEGVAAVTGVEFRVECVGGSDVRSPRVGSLVRSRGYCSGDVPTQPDSDTSTVTPSGALYFTSTLAWRLPYCPTPRAWLMSSRGVDPADFSRSVIASRLSTWKPMWWMPLQPLPRSTPATASFLKLRIARLMSPSLR